MRFAFLILVPLLSAATRSNAAARVGFQQPGFDPYFGQVQVLMDAVSRPLDVGLLRSLDYKIPSDLDRDVNLAPTPKKMATLNSDIQPGVLSIYRESLGEEPWFSLLKPQRVDSLELSGAIQIAENMRDIPPATMRQVAHILREAGERINDQKTLPVVVVNSLLFKRNRRMRIPDVISGYAWTIDRVRRIAREMGIALPERGLVMITNASLLGDIYSYPPDATVILAHEIGHQTGLVHVRDSDNLMHLPTPTERTGLNQKQRDWIRDWRRAHRN